MPADRNRVVLKDVSRVYEGGSQPSLQEPGNGQIGWNVHFLYVQGLLQYPESVYVPLEVTDNMDIAIERARPEVMRRFDETLDLHENIERQSIIPDVKKTSILRRFFRRDK